MPIAPHSSGALEDCFHGRLVQILVLPQLSLVAAVRPVLRRGGRREPVLTAQGPTLAQPQAGTAHVVPYSCYKFSSPWEFWHFPFVFKVEIVFRETCQQYSVATRQKNRFIGTTLGRSHRRLQLAAPGRCWRAAERGCWAHAVRCGLAGRRESSPRQGGRPAAAPLLLPAPGLSFLRLCFPVHCKVRLLCWRSGVLLRKPGWPR